MRWRKVLSLLLCVVLLFSICASSATVPVFAEGEDKSFSTFASSAASAFAQAIYDTDASVDFGDAAGSVGNYGGVIGFSTDNENVSWLQTKTSFAEAQISYDAISRVGVNRGLSGFAANVTSFVLGLFGIDTGTDESSSSDVSGVWAYCQYGYLLNDLGLDKTGGSGMHLIRFVSGWGMLLMYVLSMAVPMLFGFVLNLLQTLNPFKFFAGIDFSSFTGANATMGGISDIDGLPAALQGLGATITNWYNAFQSFSEYIVIPMFFVILCLTLLLSKKAGKGSVIKKYVLRLFVIFMCVPICGSVYTSVLEQMGDSTEIGYAQSSMIVKSTFVDFEKWAKTSRLGLPPDLSFSIDANDSTSDDVIPSEASGVSSATSSRIREIAYKINSIQFKNDGTILTTGMLQADGTTMYLTGKNSGLTWNRAVTNGVTAAAIGVTGALTDTSKEQLSEVAEIFDLLIRYSSADFYTSSMFESDAKSLIDKAGVETEDKDKLFGASDEPSDFQDGKDFQFGEDHFSEDNAYLNIWGNGGLSFSNNSFSSNGEKGLSTMSMYNYLNSKFGRTSVTMYSTDSSSDFVRQSHFSVNLIGNGLMSALYWFNALLMLASLSVVGICYAFGMFINVLKRSFKFISSVPFALLGSIKAGARIITYTVMMIIEIIGTMFVYTLVAQIIISFSTVMEEGLWNALAPIIRVLSFMPIFTILMQLLSIILLIWLLVMAMRFRKSFVKSIDEAASGIIDKFFDTNAMPSPPEPKQSPFKSGLAQGAGAAMGARAMSSGMNRMNGNGSGAPGTKTVNNESMNGSGGGWSDEGSPEMIDVEGVDVPSGVTSDGTSEQGAFEGHDLLALPGGSSLTESGSMSMGADMAGADAAVAGGGEPGMGQAAGKITDTAFKDNNARVEQQEGNAILNGESLEQHKEAQENADARFMAEANGDISAMESEHMDEQVAQARKEAMAQAAKDTAQVVVGAAEVAGAAATGDASLAKDGVKNVVKGTEGLALDAKAPGEERARQDAQAVQRLQEQKDYSSESHEINTSAKKTLGTKEASAPKSLNATQSQVQAPVNGGPGAKPLDSSVMRESGITPDHSSSGGQSQSGQNGGNGPRVQNVRAQHTQQSGPVINNGGSSNSNQQITNMDRSAFRSDDVNKDMRVDQSRVTRDESVTNGVDSKRVVATNDRKQRPDISRQTGKMADKPVAKPVSKEKVPSKRVGGTGAPATKKSVSEKKQAQKRRRQPTKRVRIVTPANQKYMNPDKGKK
ncbi:MAG: hypothetical protein HDQ88_08975 [Clostridia bacterium]|nr:hypothetical protein [Clostridia bacterium]